MALSLVLQDRSVYAHTVLDRLMEEIKPNQMSYCRKLYLFIRHIEHTNREKFIRKYSQEIIGCKGRWEKNSNICKKKLSKIDAMQSLIDVLGEDRFIKLAIESSYFFSKEVVEMRLADMRKDVEDGNSLPVRKDNAKRVDIGNTKGSRGNILLNSYINKHTGFNMSEGKNAVLQNFIVSHIWGNASHPYFYTNLWNVAFIPAWANHLMDKDNAVGSVGSKLKNTIKKLCFDMYSLDELLKQDEPWNNDFPKSPDEDIKVGMYNVSVIQKTDNPRKLGDIVCNVYIVKK